MLEHDLKNTHITKNVNGGNQSTDLTSKNQMNLNYHETPRNQSHLRDVSDKAKVFIDYNDANEGKNMDMNIHDSYHTNDQAKYPYPCEEFDDKSKMETSKMKDSTDSEKYNEKYANYTYTSMVDPVINKEDVAESERRIRELAAEKKMTELQNSKYSSTGMNVGDKKKQRATSFDDQAQSSKFNAGGANDNLERRFKPKYNEGVYDDQPVESYYDGLKGDYVSKDGRNVSIKQRGGQYNDNQDMDLMDSSNIKSDPGIFKRDDYEYGDNFAMKKSTIDETPRENNAEMTAMKDNMQKDNMMNNQMMGGEMMNAAEVTNNNTNKNSNISDSKKTKKMKNTQNSHDKPSHGVWSTITNYIGADKDTNKSRGNASGVDDTWEAHNDSSKNLSSGMPGGLMYGGLTEPKSQMKTKNDDMMKEVNPTSQKYGLSGGSNGYNENTNMKSQGPNMYHDQSPEDYSYDSNVNNSNMNKKMNKNAATNYGTRSNKGTDDKIFSVQGASECAGMDYAMGRSAGSSGVVNLNLHDKAKGNGANTGAIKHDVTSDLVTESNAYRMVQNPDDSKHLMKKDATNLNIPDKSARDFSNGREGDSSDYDVKKAGRKDKEEMKEYVMSGVSGNDHMDTIGLNQTINSNKLGSKMVNPSRTDNDNEGHYAGKTTRGIMHGDDFNGAYATNAGEYNMVDESGNKYKMQTNEVYMTGYMDPKGNNMLSGGESSMDKNDEKRHYDERKDAEERKDTGERKDDNERKDSNEKPIDKLKHMFVKHDSKKGKKNEYGDNTEKKNLHEHGTLFKQRSGDKSDTTSGYKSGMNHTSGMDQTSGNLGTGGKTSNMNYTSGTSGMNTSDKSNTNTSNTYTSDDRFNRNSTLSGIDNEANINYAATSGNKEYNDTSGIGMDPSAYNNEYLTSSGQNYGLGTNTSKEFNTPRGHDNTYMNQDTNNGYQPEQSGQLGQQQHHRKKSFIEVIKDAF